MGAHKAPKSEVAEGDGARVRGLDSVFGICGKWKRDRGLTHEELMQEPLVLLLLEDLDQPYTDYNGAADEEEHEVIDGADGLRGFLGIKG